MLPLPLKFIKISFFMKKHRTKIYILAALFLFPSFVLAESIDVTATPPSGTYHTPIRIELNTTQPGAKTFYSFKPDGYPQDAYLYTGAILLKKSSPLIFFSIISPTNESKIKQNDYVIEYSPDVHFRDTEVVLGSDNMVDVALINESDKDIDIGFYQVQSESSMTEILEGTILASGKIYTVSFQYTGKSPIVLRSPDGEERGILQVVRAEPKPAPRTISPSSTSPSTSYARPREIEKVPTSENTPSAQDASILEQPTEPVTETPVLSESTPVPESALPPSPEPSVTPEPTPAVSPESTPATSDIGADIKTSVLESGTNMKPLYIFFLVGISLFLGIIQFVVRSKKNPHLPK